MRTHVVLPDDLVAGVDALVGKRGRSRFIAEAAGEKLRKESLKKAIRDGAGILDPSKHPEWSTPEKVAEWVRAQRAIPTAFEKSHGNVPVGRKRSD